MGRISLCNYFLDSTNLIDDSQLVELSLQCCLCTETFYFFHNFQMLQCLLATAELSWRSDCGPCVGCRRLTCPHCRRKLRNSRLVRLYSVLGCVFVGGATWPPPAPPQKLPWQSVAESTGLTPGGLGAVGMQGTRPGPAVRQVKTLLLPCHSGPGLLLFLFFFLNDFLEPRMKPSGTALVGHV